MLGETSQRHPGVPAFRARCRQRLDDYPDRIGLPAGGAVRVSLGVATTLAGVESFPDFAERTYRDRRPDLTGLAPRLGC